MPLFQHKLTGTILELKKRYKNICSYYVLDKENKRIKNGVTTNLETSYKTVLCLNINVKEAICK